jgi:hypothetical protein
MNSENEGRCLIDDKDLPIVLVHGTMGELQDLLRAVEELSKSRSVIRPNILVSPHRLSIRLLQAGAPTGNLFVPLMLLELRRQRLTFLALHPAAHHREIRVPGACNQNRDWT